MLSIPSGDVISFHFYMSFTDIFIRQIVFEPLLEASFAAKLVHVVDWITLITRAGITVMNEDMASQMGDPSFLDFSHDLDEWDLPMLSTDLDGSLELVSSTAQVSGRHGPFQPLPKMKSHTRVVRPRVEPRLCLQNGIPTLSQGAPLSSMYPAFSGIVK